MAEIEVPPYFLCPIALEIMKDPVTITTGITYDRESIEKWIFVEKKNTCPVTKQILFDNELTPNITLRRLIQSWCTLHSSYNIQRLPTPKPPVTRPQLLKLLDDANCPQMQFNSLKKLKSIASENQTNKRSIEAVRAPDFLANLITEKSFEETKDLSETKKIIDEALSILYTLQLSESGLKSLANGEFIESLTQVMQHGTDMSKLYSIMLLKSILEVADPSQIISLRPELFVELARILKDQISPKVSKVTLKILITICPLARNRIKAVEAGAVSVLVDLLLDSCNKRESEMLITLLDFLCQCADGRAELVKHGAGLAVVSKKVLRVSHVASERAVRILHSVSKYSATSAVLQEMLHIGVVGKLCLVLQVDCGSKTKERAREMLKVNARAWRTTSNSCIPHNLVSSYPS